MRKLLYGTAIALTLAACKKDKTTPSTLFGTSWTTRTGKTYYETLLFQDAGKVQVSGNLTGSNYVKDGTYNIDEGSVTLETSSEFKIGYVSGNILVLYSDAIQMAYNPELGIVYNRN